MAQRRFVTEILDESRDVLPPLTQGRDVERGHRDPVKQVHAEPVSLRLRPQILVGRGEQSELDHSRLSAPERIHLAPLQNAQQVGLQLQRHLSDLVEKQCSTVRRFDLPNHTGAPGTGEGTVYIAEQLARQKVSRQTSTVQGHEQAVFAVPLIMNGTSK